MEKKMKCRRNGKAIPPMTKDEIHDLKPEDLDGLEAEISPGLWVRPERWMGSGDDIEVIL
jgi:hypothetical protein